MVEPADPETGRAVPGIRDWERLGLRSPVEVSGGHQSRVFTAHADELVIVKLTDGRLVEREWFERRVDAVVELSAAAGDVVGPRRHQGAFVNRLGEWLAVVYPFVDGSPPDIDHESDVWVMGRTLAVLHRSMALLSTEGIPPVAALRTTAPRPVALTGARTQLLHGDFSAVNLRHHAGRIRVFDFDDCGTGPVAFDVGNTLYMALFDATLNGDPSRYRSFRSWFIDSYRAQSDDAVDDDALDSVIDLRRFALRHWLEHPSEAPIGVRTSSPAWRRRLRSFTDPP